MPDSALAVADELDDNDGANMLRGDEAEAATGGLGYVVTMSANLCCFMYLSNSLSQKRATKLQNIVYEKARKILDMTTRVIDNIPSDLVLSITLPCIGVLLTRIATSWIIRGMCPRQLFLKTKPALALAEYSSSLQETFIGYRLLHVAYAAVMSRAQDLTTKALSVVQQITSFTLWKAASGLTLLVESICDIDGALALCTGATRVWAKYNGIVMNEQMSYYMSLVSCISLTFSCLLSFGFPFDQTLIIVDCVPCDRQMERAAPSTIRLTAHFASILVSCSTLLYIRALHTRDVWQAGIYKTDLSITDFIRHLSKSILLIYIFAPDNANIVTALALACLVRARNTFQNRASVPRKNWTMK